MQRRRTLAIGLTAALLVGRSVSPGLAQDPEDLAELEAEQTASHVLTGTITFIPDGLDPGEYGEYYLELDDGSTVELDAGPPWYWGESHPLSDLVGMSVEVSGHLEAARPVAAEPPDDSAPTRQELEVLAIDGTVIREVGPPPWAGAPSWAGAPWAAGPEHPGYQGWSRGQAMDAMTERTEQPTDQPG